jgi:hypothetical protein
MKQLGIWFYFSAALGLSGCAANFGADHRPTLVKVMSSPPGTHFVLLDWNLSNGLLKTEGGKLIPIDAVKLQRHIREADLGLRTSDRPLTRAAGRHVLVLLCSKGAQYEGIELHGGMVNDVTVSCQ